MAAQQDTMERIQLQVVLEIMLAMPVEKDITVQE